MKAHSCFLLPNVACLACGRALSGTVVNNTQITVSCTRPDPTGWPASFKVTLTATAGDASCLGTQSQDATITSSTKPQISVLAPNDPKICSTEESKDFEFTLSSSSTPTVNVTSITPANCGLYPSTTSTVGEFLKCCVSDRASSALHMCVHPCTRGQQQGEVCLMVI
jgi:hypothetical protein